MEATDRSYRDLLGRFASGVLVITGHDEDGPCGLTCQSFFSLSLRPRLLALGVGTASRSWPRISATGRCCVTILAADQSAISDRFARSGHDKFAGVPWRLSGDGLPRLDGALAWLDCRIVNEQETGDHLLVVAQVEHAETGPHAPPLVFHRGAYATATPWPRAC